MKYGTLMLALVICVGIHISPVHAGAKEEAEEHFRAGVSLQKVEDFEAAIIEFETSLRLFPTKSALFNLANCLKATHRYAEALNVLERLQREYGASLEEPMRSAVETQTAELLKLTARLRVEVDRPGAEVRVDGTLIGRSPLAEPLRLGLGEHQIQVNLEGFETETVRVKLMSGKDTVEQIVLRPAEPKSAAPAPVLQKSEQEPPRATRAAPRKDSNRSLRTWGFITAGSGAALTVAGAVTGIWALSVDDDLSDVCEGQSCPPAKSSDIDKLNTLTTTTNVLIGSGITLSATGVVMLFLAAPKTEGPEADRAHAKTRWDVGLGSGFVSARLRHEF